MPSSTRPPERRSSVATAFAVTAKLRCGTMRIPVPSLISDVTEATKAIHISGSGMSMSSRLPGILPSSEYGYGVW